MTSGKIGNQNHTATKYWWVFTGHLSGAALAFIWLGILVTAARSDLHTDLEEIVSDVRDVEAEDILDQLVNIIDDQRYP